MTRRFAPFARPAAEGTGRDVLTTRSPARRSIAVSSVICVMLLALAVRLALGMRSQLEADEATFAIAGLRITQGHLLLMEPNAQYLGALDAYVSAPFIAILGPTLFAVRLASAAVGALYVLA